jgi:outer membrane protein assembly factor BamB
LTTVPVLGSFFPITATVVKQDRPENLIIFRNYSGVEARSLKTGKMAWRSPSSWSLENLLGDKERRPDTRKKQALEAYLAYYLTQQQMPQILFENSVYGTLSTDNVYAYAVEDFAVPPNPGHNGGLDPRLGPGMGGPALFGEDVANANRHSKLRALKLSADGKEDWTVGGVGGKDELADSFFLGPPLPLGGKLYVLTEKQQELRLVCLDPSRKGKVVGVQTLATTHEKLENDVPRRIHAAHLAYGDGILVVPTNAGAVFGIDLLENRLVWAYPYRDRDDNPPRAGPRFPGGGFIPGPDGMPLPTMPRTGDWKEAAPCIADGKVVFTAPDARSLHCVHLLDGAQLWTYRRQEDDLFFAGVYRGKVLVVGKKQCRALDLADGKLLWSVDTGMPPSGQGIASDNIYYLPLHDPDPAKARSEICAIDVDRGAVAAHTAARNKEEVPGNLLFYDGEVVSVSADAVAAYPQLKVKIAQMDERLARNPDDPEGLTERGTLRLDQGDRLGAIEDLRKAIHNRPSAETRARARGKLYDALTEYAEQRFGDAEEYLGEYEALCRADLDGVTDEAERARRLEVSRKRRANFLFLVAKGREKQGKLVEAFEKYQEFAAAAGPDELVTVRDEPAVRANADVWARGRIAAMVAAASPEQRRPLEALIAARWERARAAGDLDEVRRFVRMFGALCDAGREARFYLAERLLERGKPGDLLEAERELCGFRTPQEAPEVAGRAVEALARLYLRRGLREDAAYCYRLLGRDYAGVKVRGGKTGADFHDEAATDKRLMPYLDEPAPPGGKLKVTEGTGAHLAAQVYVFAQVGEPLPYFRHHAVALRFDNQHLQVIDTRTGAPVMDQQVENTLLQTLVPNLGGQPTAARFPYRSRGHLVVLPIAHMVYGIDPVNRQVLWQRNLAGVKYEGGGGVPRPLVTQHVAVDPRDGTLQVLFQGGWKQRLGSAGPLQGSVVCLQSRDALEAVDPLTGQTLWQRTDMTGPTDVFADEQYVYVVELSAETNKPLNGRVLRAADGATVRDAPNFAAAYEHRSGAPGRHLLVADRPAGGGVTLRLCDVVTGKDLWTQELPAGSVVLHSQEPGLAGAVGPDGAVRVWDLASGREVLHTDKGYDFLNRKTGIDPTGLANLQAVHLLADAQALYLACEGPPDPNLARFGGVMPNVMPGLGLRCLPVNGRIYAYDRARGTFKFHVQAAHQLLLLERFRDMPVLVLTAMVPGIPAGAGVRAMPGMIYTTFLAVDKRSGKVLHQFQPPPPAQETAQFHTVHIDDATGKVELVSAKTTIIVQPESALAGWPAASRPASGPGVSETTGFAPPVRRVP